MNCLQVVRIGALLLMTSTVADSSDIEALQGIWYPESFIIAGAEQLRLPTNTFSEMEWHFEKDHFSIRKKSQSVVAEFSFVLNEKTDPKQIDIQYCGTKKEQQEFFRGGIKGIYKIEDGKFFRCNGPPRGPRPKSFQAVNEAVNQDDSLMIFARRRPAH
jgi:uncharacterized protein (TIGR03067 family)